MIEIQLISMASYVSEPVATVKPDQTHHLWGPYTESDAQKGLSMQDY